MTKNEIIIELEKLGIDFEIITDHGDGMHIIVRFDEEEEE